MAVPGIPVFGTNGNIPSGTLSALVQLALFARDPTAVLARRLASQSISSGSFTDIVHDTEIIDTDGGFAPSSATITLVNPGYYIVMPAARFAAASGGTRSLRGLQNGADIVGCYSEVGSASGVDFVSLSCCQLISAAAGDTVKATVFQNQGGAVNLLNGALSVVRVSGPRS